MRTILPLLTVLLLPGIAAADDEAFDLWRFPAPEGWTKTRQENLFALTRVDVGEFCQVVLYKSRPPVPGQPEAEFAKEWKEVVEPRFKTGAQTQLKERRLKSGALAQGSSAEFRDSNDKVYFGVLYVLAPYGQITSVVVTSNTAASFEKYERMVGDFLDSLKPDTDAAVAKAPAPGKPEEFAGRWAASSGGWISKGVAHASSKHQYDFRKDGTYTYRREMWGGGFQADTWFLAEERGTWTVEGAKVTVVPSAGTAIVKNRAGDVVQTSDPTLEKVTYLWGFYLFKGLGETQLVLTPPGPTDRDGRFASNDLFQSSYLLSAKYVPEWRTFPK